MFLISYELDIVDILCMSEIGRLVGGRFGIMGLIILAMMPLIVTDRNEDLMLLLRNI